jgi:N4-gp56 family major capsid protein
MTDAQFSSSALSAAITFKVQKKVLENLRAELVFADQAYAEQGDFMPGFDTLKFVSVPDLSFTGTTTPLTEGTRPDKRSMSISTVSVSTDQYGDLISITDIAKVKSPLEITAIASERLSRVAAQAIDKITRDVVAAGGTPFYATESNGDANTSRAGLSSTAKLKAADLRKLRATMYKNSIPTFGDGYYRLWISPEQGYDLRNDTNTGAFIDVNKYATPETLLRGELGRMEGFRIMEVVNTATFASTATVHAGIALGNIKGWGAGELQTLKTYYVAPGGDHQDPLGQEELIGFKVNFGCAVLSNSYYYRVESAATAL